MKSKPGNQRRASREIDEESWESDEKRARILTKRVPGDQ